MEDVCESGGIPAFGFGGGEGVGIGATCFFSLLRFKHVWV